MFNRRREGGLTNHCRQRRMALSVPLSRPASPGPACVSSGIRHRPHFMHLPSFIITAVLTAAFVIGCSTASRNQSAKMRDLGVVELSPNVPKHVSLGHGKDCVVTLAVLPDGDYQMNIFTETKTADGKIERSCT